MRDARPATGPSIIHGDDRNTFRYRQAYEFLDQARHAEAHLLWRSIFDDTADPQDGLSAAIAAFRIGAWKEAWSLYENRYLRNPSSCLTSITCAETGKKIPLWSAGPPPDRLLVIAEQGLGDTFQFARYLPRLLEAGVEVTLAEWPRLHPILSTLHPALKLAARGEAITHEAGDAFVRLLSLPLRMGIFDPFFDAPYFRVREAPTSRWSRVLDRGKLNIGLVWQGNPDHEHDFKRSISLELFAPLFERAEFRIVSLQYADGAEQVNSASFGPKLVLPKGLFSGRSSFLKTASLLSELDGIVTVDTASAHIAGALGCPVYLLLHAPDPDWRWGINSTSTAWYPETRIFRQRTHGVWADVIDTLTTELLELAQSRRRLSPSPEDRGL